MEDNLKKEKTKDLSFTIKLLIFGGLHHDYHDFWCYMAKNLSTHPDF